MVERCLDGRRISAQALGHRRTLRDARVVRSQFRISRTLRALFVQNGGELPSALPAEIQEDVRALVAQAARVLGVTSCAMKADIVVHDGKAWLIDLATTICGGPLCTREFRSPAASISSAPPSAWLWRCQSDGELEPRKTAPSCNAICVLHPDASFRSAVLKAARESSALRRDRHRATRRRVPTLNDRRPPPRCAGNRRDTRHCPLRRERSPHPNPHRDRTDRLGRAIRIAWYE